MDKEKLHRFASNSITNKEEIESILDWIEQDNANQKEFNEIKNLYSYSGFANFDELAKDVFGKKTKPANQIKRIQLAVYKYAAIFLLAFLIGGFSFYLIQNKLGSNGIANNEVIVPFGESAEVILADNTHVWLNSGAKLEYPQKFNKDLREVKLTGEAYFEVTHNEKKPFHVLTPHLSINVLGTSFNVEAFEKSAEANVTLVEGKVRLENLEGKVMAVLKPDQNALYSADNDQINITKVNTSFYTSWKDGTIFFRDEKLEYIAQKLERWFNVEIVFDDESVRDLKFTGAILKNKPIDQIMDILKFTSNVDYSIQIRNENPNLIILKKMPM
ncbi:FecR family protein [Sunxiuqinia sp. A32]|uniref:FecR family protein n=1 Tax=Sunxiuqinia sp. A32 TaxID=3461496 RepID=UPI0040458A87